MAGIPDCRLGLAELLQTEEKGSMTRVIVVKAAFNPDVGVGYTESSDMRRLRIEAPTLEALVERVTGAVQDLLEDGGQTADLDIPIEVIAYASTRIRVPFWCQTR